MKSLKRICSLSLRRSFLPWSLLLALASLAHPCQAAAPVVLTNASAHAFPDFLSAVNASSKGWMFAPPVVGLRYVKLNGVLLTGNTGTNDPDSGLAFTSPAMPYAVPGFGWTNADQTPARNGICRGGIHGNKQEFTLNLAATPGHAYLVEILALDAFAPKRSMTVRVDSRTVAKDWTITADGAHNRVLRLQVVADQDGIDLQFAPGSVPGTDQNPAITALALTDLTDGLWTYDDTFGRIPPGLVNIAATGTASSPDDLEQDGDGRGDRAAIDGDPGTYWDEQDRARLYRLVVGFKQPEKVAALGVMGWAQHEFAPKDFEVLCNGRSLKKVENAAYENNVWFLSIPETTCRSVELAITGYYGGSPAIRELGLFRRVAAPPDVASQPTAAAPPSGLTAATVGESESMVMFNGQPICVYAYGREQWKPYVRELHTLRGDNVLRDSPFDHKHHHALMYGIKVNGVNFWEEVAGSGVQKPVETVPFACEAKAQGGLRAVLRQTLHWLAREDAARPGSAAAALLIERRTLTLTVDEAHREVALHWHSAFEVGPKTNQVTLTGANYHGLGMRFLQALDPFARHFNSGGAPDLSGTKQDVSQHRWGAVAFARPSQPATLVLHGHPGNVQGDWFFTMRQPFAYLSVTQHLDQEPLVYRSGDKFELNYLITLYPELKTPPAIEARARQWRAD